MLELARAAQPEPLNIAIELALTTGMRRGEVCALRWSDLGDDGTISISHALGNGEGGFYLKDAKTVSSARTIPLTPYMYSMTLDIYADVDPQAKESAVGKIEQCFAGYNLSDGTPPQNPFDGGFSIAVENIPFTKEQLEFMLAALEAKFTGKSK